MSPKVNCFSQTFVGLMLLKCENLMFFFLVGDSELIWISLDCWPDKTFEDVTLSSVKLHRAFCFLLFSFHFIDKIVI